MDNVFRGQHAGCMRGLTGTAARQAVASVALAMFASGGVPAEAAPGPRWTVVPTATGAALGALVAVSCPSANACVAVGTQDTPGAYSNRLIERWNGARWAVQVSPVPKTAYASSFAATTTCFAVGEYRLGTTPRPLLLHYA